MSKNTLLYAAHVEQEAKMIDFNGWNMPLQYKTGIIKEHLAVREGVGIFDTSHMGEFILVDTNVRATLNKLLAGDFTKVRTGRMRYSFICNEAGGVQDDVVVFILSEQEAMVCVNAGDIAGDYAQLTNYLPEGAVLEEQSASTGKVDIQGPLACKVVEKLTGFDLRTFLFYSFIVSEWQGSPMILSRSGYTGSAGVEIFVDADALGQLWYYALEAGSEYGLIPCGLGARDTLRLEAGLPLYGHELSAQINPLMTGYAGLVSLSKAEDFPGKAALQAIENSGNTAQLLVGLQLESKRIAREGSAILAGGVEVGRITSGGPGIFVGGSIALGYINQDLAALGGKVELELGRTTVEAVVSKLPFYATPELRQVLPEKQ